MKTLLMTVVGIASVLALLGHTQSAHAQGSAGITHGSFGHMSHQLTLARIGAPTHAAATVLRMTAPPTRDAVPSRTRLDIGLASIGLGAMALGIGIKYGLDARELGSDNQNRLNLRVKAQKQQKRRRMALSFGAGAAAVLTGGILVYLGSKQRPRKSRKRLMIAPSIGQHSLAMHARGRF